MAEFVEVIRQAHRMCDAYDCDHCPITYESVLCALASDKDLTCAVIKKFESKVMQWAKEHPEPRYPTWEEWHSENFPNASATFTPCTFTSTSELGCAATNCRACKSRPIPADIAKKLGIKPKEVQM